MPITFSEFLKKVRNTRKLTQQEVIDLLIESDDVFSKLDLTTFSRWERGVTSPKLARQLLVARIMDEDVALLIDPEAKPAKKKVTNFEQIRLRVRNPYSSDVTPFTTHHYKSLSDQSALRNKLMTFHQDYLGMNVNLSDFEHPNLMLDVFIDSSGVLIGHLLYGYLDTSKLDSGYVPSLLSECDFLQPKEHINANLTLYVISVYSALASPRMVIVLMLLDILRQNNNIRYLQANCHDQEGYAFYESNSDCELTSKGPSLPFGGVKVYGKHFRYVRIKTNTESLLACALFSEMLPFTHDYIQKLLNKYS
tara:strand:+ start:2420 stop:3343 length:924 start_codon:yes stop_codon:yes gene_type:complete